MHYSDLYGEAEALVELERKNHALKKLTSLMAKINQQETIVEHARKNLVELEDDLKDLCTHRVGYPSTAWTPLGTRPTTGMIKNIT